MGSWLAVILRIGWPYILAAIVSFVVFATMLANGRKQTVDNQIVKEMEKANDVRKEIDAIDGNAIHDRLREWSR